MTSLQDVISATHAKKAGDGFLGKCVAHEDDKASLSIKESNGKLLLNCFVGCSYESIRAALESRGVAFTGAGDKGWETVYEVREPGTGKVLAKHIRIDKNTGKEFRWCGPDGGKLTIPIASLPLYGADKLGLGDPTRIIVVEGEKACDALWKIVPPIPAVSTYGANAIPKASGLEILRGREVFLFPDADDAGRKCMAQIGVLLDGLGIPFKTIVWDGAPQKGDAYDFVSRGNGLPELEALIAKIDILDIPILADGINEAVEELDRYQQGDFSHMVQTGIPSLDKRLGGGFMRGAMILVGAVTGGGKTSLLQQICNTALERGPILFISPEMSNVELGKREIIRRAKVAKWDRNPWTQSKGAQDHACEKHLLASEEVRTKRAPFYVLDDPGVTMTDVAEAARKIHRAHGLALVLVDYAQQVAGETDNKNTRYLQVAAVGTKAIALAKALKVPVVVASQVNLEVKGKRRTFTFRETAMLEHVAHTVLILDVEWETHSVKTSIGTFDTRRVASAQIVAQKAREGTFRLPVEYVPELFLIEDKKPEPEEDDDPQESLLRPLPNGG